MIIARTRPGFQLKLNLADLHRSPLKGRPAVPSAEAGCTLDVRDFRLKTILRKNDFQV
jgi:hypothetical protein